VVRGNNSNLRPARVLVAMCYSVVCCPLELRARQCRCGSGGKDEEEGKEGGRR